MTKKVRMVNNHLLSNIADDKKRLQVDEFQGLRHTDDKFTSVGATGNTAAGVDLCFQR
jgi:hypothetical protein